VRAIDLRYLQRWSATRRNTTEEVDRLLKGLREFAA